MFWRPILFGFATARDAVARALIRLGVTPNALTIAGAALTVAAGVCLAFGAQSRFAWSFSPAAPANAYLLLAGAALILSAACDMLDGAVARLGGAHTPFGAVLDSTLDRVSDFAVYAGIAASYAWSSPANLTFVLLSMMAFFNAFMISYTRARAEDLIEFCGVGFWQRGERWTALLIATFAHNVPALVVQQAILPVFTVARRLRHARSVLNGKTPITDPRQGRWIHKVCFWRWPRKTLGHEITCAINIAWLIFAPIDAVDWLRSWLA